MFSVICGSISHNSALNLCATNVVLALERSAHRASLHGKFAARPLQIPSCSSSLLGFGKRISVIDSCFCERQRHRSKRNAEDRSETFTNSEDENIENVGDVSRNTESLSDSSSQQTRTSCICAIRLDITSAASVRQRTGHRGRTLGPDSLGCRVS